MKSIKLVVIIASIVFFSNFTLAQQNIVNDKQIVSAKTFDNAKKIIQDECDVNHDEQVHEIVLNGTPNDVKKFLLSGYNVNKTYNCTSLIITAIKSAARGSYAYTNPDYAAQKIKILIEAGADVNVYSCPDNSMLPLAWAVTLPEQMRLAGNDIFKNIEDKIKEGTEYCDFPNLVSKPCKDISLEEKRQIERAIIEDFQTITKLLEKSFMNIVTLLINSGADINGTDIQNQSILHHAVINPKNTGIKYVKYLIEKGANVNAKDVYGYTPLFLAQGLNNTEIVNVLINAGADINAQAKNGVTYKDVATHIKRKSYYDDN